MTPDEVTAKAARLTEIMGQDDPPEADQREAVNIGLSLLGGACLNLAKIAAAVEFGPVPVEIIQTNR